MTFLYQVDEFKKQLIQQKLCENDWKFTRTGRANGLTARQVRYLVNKYQLEKSSRFSKREKWNNAL